MTKNFNQRAVADIVEFGKNGNVIDASNNHISFTDASNNYVEIRGATATHNNSFVTKSQLDNATGADAGTIWIEFDDKPNISDFNANSRKLMVFSSAAATLKTAYSSVPSSTQYDGSNDISYCINTNSNLITANNVDKQSHVISVEFTYDNVGSMSNADVGGTIELVEFDGSTEYLYIVKQWRKANNDGQDGTITIDFNTNVNSNVNSSGKGWRLYFRLNESDSNASISLDSLRIKSG